MSLASATPPASNDWGACLTTVALASFLSLRPLAAAMSAERPKNAIVASGKARRDKQLLRSARKGLMNTLVREVWTSVHGFTHDDPAVTGLDQIQGFAAGHRQFVGLMILTEPWLSLCSRLRLMFRFSSFTLILDLLVIRWRRSSSQAARLVPDGVAKSLPVRGKIALYITCGPSFGPIPDRIFHVLLAFALLLDSAGAGLAGAGAAGAAADAGVDEATGAGAAAGRPLALPPLVCCLVTVAGKVGGALATGVSGREGAGLVTAGAEGYVAGGSWRSRQSCPRVVGRCPLAAAGLKSSRIRANFGATAALLLSSCNALP